MFVFSLQLIGACLLDALIGDPRSLPHPVRGIGALISSCEHFTRRLFTNQKVAGTATFWLVLLITLTILIGPLLLLQGFSPFLTSTIAVLLLYTSIACRDLLWHSNQVMQAILVDQDLTLARSRLQMIVGRDTAELDEAQICRATVETVAENMVDGIISPLFFAFVGAGAGLLSGGAPVVWAVCGAYGYKAINTMDSMIAYKNERYLQFGAFAAKADDLANFLPARITGICLIIAAFFLKLDYTGAAKTFFRDRLQHASPNAGHPEAAVAGALGIQLGGAANYFGKTVVKPILGEGGRAVAPADIHLCQHLVVVGSCFFIVVSLVLLNICFR